MYGEQGHPVRTTVSELGPLLLSRLLDLNETQEGVLQIIFRHADESGLLLLDFADLSAMLAWANLNAAELSGKYGNVTKPSVGSIQRQLLSFEAQGADHFFGEPALEIDDFLKVDDQGRGYAGVLAADKLMRSPKLYATFLLWLLAELFETLPKLDVETAITELKVGEALVSTLDEDGAPTIAERTLIKPPRSRLGPVTPKERAIIQSISPLEGKYDTRANRKSAAEVLAAKAADAAATAEQVEAEGEEAVRGQARKSPSLWGKALSQGAKVALGGAAGAAASRMLGKQSRANPVASGVTSAVGSIATDLAGPIVGRFVRNLIGGLMR